MWNLDSGRPIYLQITERIEFLICSGTYQPGDKIPSVRNLAQEAGVNPNTMQRALQELENKGILCSFRTTNRTVTEDEYRIQSLKKEIAKNQISDFLSKMKNIGFSKEEIITLLNEEG